MTPDRKTFRQLAQQGNLITLSRRLMSDQLTPVMAYRRLVAPDERSAPSFLFESVENGITIGRYSFLGAQPAMEVLAFGNEVTVLNHHQTNPVDCLPPTQTFLDDDPLSVPQRLTQSWKPVDTPHAFENTGGAGFSGGGWIGFAGYDTVRYLEPEKLPFSAAPGDDRHLPDMHFCLYRDVAVFDHVEKILHVVHHVLLNDHESVDAAYDAGEAHLAEYVDRIETPAAPILPGSIALDLAAFPQSEMESNFARMEYETAVARCKEYIAAGDAFQIVLSQRFKRATSADPFDIYRALRIVNPSPYMIYLQGQGVILVASSPEILCRVQNGVVTNRPLAGTRPRGKDESTDLQYEQELLADEKEQAEHVMLVDLGRNDLGRVCELASIELEKVLVVERYSHVMHLSSTVTGTLRPDLNCWDALRYTLPVGTVSGAPKVRAMQIIDELEPTRRGPYAGGIGGIGFTGNMDIALALRTMVIPTDMQKDGRWNVHLQAGAGIVADSVPAREYQETVKKAAALGRAIDLAETAFRKWG